MGLKRFGKWLLEPPFNDKNNTLEKALSRKDKKKKKNSKNDDVPPNGGIDGNPLTSF